MVSFSFQIDLLRVNFDCVSKRNFLVIMLFVFAAAAWGDEWVDRKGRRIQAEYVGFDQQMKIKLAGKSDKVIAVTMNELSSGSQAHARKVGVEYFVSSVQKSLPWFALYVLGTTFLTAVAVFATSRTMGSTYTWWTAAQCAGFFFVVASIVVIGVLVGISISHKITVAVFLTIGILSPVAVLSKMFGVSSGGGVVYFLCFLFYASLLIGGSGFLLMRFGLFSDSVYAVRGMLFSLFV